jgi:hypothetical protein
MERPKRRLRSAGGIVVEMVELVVHRQPDSGAISCLLKDQEIAEQACLIANRTAGLIATNPKQRVYDPPVDPDVAKTRRHGVQIVPLGR